MTKRCMIFMTATAAVFALIVSAGPSSGSAGSRGLALTGARVHTVSGPVVDDAILLVKDGLIEAVGADIAIPPGYEVVALGGGAEIYPAVIDADSDMGRVEIGSVRGTVDIAEVGKIHPDVRAEIAVNADSEHVRVTRAGGVLLSLTVPRGGILAGTSALLKLSGWNWEEMAVKAPAAMHLFWPQMKIRTESGGHHHEGRERKSKEEQEKERAENLAALEDAFKDARAYWKAKKGDPVPGVHHKTNTAWEAMGPVLDGTIPLVIHGGDIRQIRAALEWSRKEEGVSLVLAGGGDIWRAADELAARKIPVILEGIHSMPRRDWEPYDTPFAAARKLHAAGVRFCIANGGGASNSRNLPDLAGMAAAFGLPREEALRAITLYPAEILGVADRYGSIAPGKEATLIVTDGDLLEIRTHVTAAFMEGRPLDLGNRQKSLYERYRLKPGGRQVSP